jgi:hypothetical protein
MSSYASHLKTYFGDIHNHCGAGYGHGSPVEAFENARMQLDFVSVTGHALWPDMPRKQHGMERRIKYHENGFRRLAECWDDFCQITEAANKDREFVTFLGYEMHSCVSGDQTIIYRDAGGKVISADTVAALQQAIRELNEAGVSCMTLPHHIGYLRGYRGINWDHFSADVSPIVEIFSMHGCSESDHTPYPYLHSMGPCDHESTYSYGLSAGHIVGVMASTDHHSAHPGSHGHGRIAVHANKLTRDDIWDAIQHRRTVALSGDNMDVRLFLNDAFIGDVIESPEHCRNLKIYISAGGALRSIELLKNESVLRRWHPNALHSATYHSKLVRAKVGLEVGWGSRGKRVDWDVRMSASDGEVINTEPRFKGAEVVSPSEEEQQCRFSTWNKPDDRSVQFKTRTQGNPTTVTNCNQGFGIEVEMWHDGMIQLELNGTCVEHSLAELLQGPRSGYISGYGTPAYRLTAALPESYEFETAFSDDCHANPPAANGMDIYRLRVEQQNRQWAWSSPIWIAR